MEAASLVRPKQGCLMSLQCHPHCRPSRPFLLLPCDINVKGPLGLLQYSTAGNLCMLAAGFAMVLDVLVSDSLLKLAFTPLLAHHAYYTDLLPGSSFDGLHHWSIWPAVLLDCLLHPKTAAVMTGPLIKRYRGGHPPNSSQRSSAE